MRQKTDSATLRSNMEKGQLHLDINLHKPQEAVLLHELFQLGGIVRHHTCGSEVKGTFKVLLIIQHPHIHLQSKTKILLLSTFQFLKFSTYTYLCAHLIEQ
ncbi:hypothetical protein AOLI_G00291990 [Acnodon oligacanthus]